MKAYPNFCQVFKPLKRCLSEREYLGCLKQMLGWCGWGRRWGQEGRTVGLCQEKRTLTGHGLCLLPGLQPHQAVSALLWPMGSCGWIHRVKTGKNPSMKFPGLFPSALCETQPRWVAFLAPEWAKGSQHPVKLQSLPLLGRSHLRAWIVKMHP